LFYFFQGEIYGQISKAPQSFLTYFYKGEKPQLYNVLYFRFKKQ